jgi:predicted SnoaL-like aldol condensation-catalyzing enzyme
MSTANENSDTKSFETGKHGWDNDQKKDDQPAGALPSVYTVDDKILQWDGIVDDYLVSGDLGEAEKNIFEFNAEHQHHILVKKAIFKAMEKQAYERELVSRLLSAFYNRVIDSSKIAQGFQYALDSVEDASIDIPDAKDTLAKFLARAIIDEVLPPKFLRTCEKIAKTESAKVVIKSAGALASNAHGSERLERIWGPGDMSSVKRLKQEAKTIIEEFLQNDDLKEAELCLRKLNTPSFHFQVVKQAVRLALDTNNQSKKIMKLLKYLASTGLFSQYQLVRGFKCCYDTLGDIMLDVPNADSLLDQLTKQARTEGWLPEDFEKV